MGHATLKGSEAFFEKFRALAAKLEEEKYSKHEKFFNMFKKISRTVLMTGAEAENAKQFIEQAREFFAGFSAIYERWRKT